LRDFARRILLLWIAGFALSVTGGCWSSFDQTKLYHHFNVDPAVMSLIQSHPEYFKKQYTLIDLIDRRACDLNIKEALWWSDWEEFAHTKQIGFVFATSAVDSDDAVISTRLDSCFAPVLVVAGSDSTISHLWSPLSTIPLKLLVDSSGSVYGMWFTINTPESSDAMLHWIDSIVTSKPRPFVRHGPSK